MLRDVSEQARVAPWRPVHFLGSKLRSLDHISAVLDSLRDGKPQTVWEPFTGSSVVAQRLAADGHTMWSCDAMSSSVEFAAAMLGCHRSSTTTSAVVCAARVRTSADLTAPSPWDRWLCEEASALQSGDGPRLLQNDLSLPQRWNASEADASLRRLFATVEASSAVTQVQFDGLISSTYAGTYFGIQQAVVLERLRRAIDEVTPASNAETAWLRSAMLTALCHAASAAVFSAGKHFAQPHRIREGKDLTFHARRALADRSVDVVEAFSDAAASIDTAVSGLGGRHTVSQVPAGEVKVPDLRDRGVTAVYADPPYTAQQYSRFYHVPEVLVAGVPVTLQRVKGTVTRGLYPSGRYLSPYSSRIRAPGAFRHLAATAANAGADLLVSYSGARAAATGNARVVSMADLVSFISDAYGSDRVTVHELDLRYRQFNQTASGVTGRDDPEYLITGRRSAR